MKRTTLTLIFFASTAMCACTTIPAQHLYAGSLSVFEDDTRPMLVSSTWWTELGAARLDRMVSMALSGNYSLKAVSQRLAAAGLLEGTAPLTVAPNLSVGASTTTVDSRLGESAASIPSSKNSSLVNFSASWEIPLFGKIAGSMASVSAQRDQLKWESEAAKVALSAAVVRGYALLTANESKVQKTAEALVLLLDAQHLESVMVSAGLANEQVVEARRTQLFQYHAQEAQLQAENTQLRSTLAVLCGVPELPATVNREKAQKHVFFVVPPSPSHLRRRPDIRAAEESVLLAAAQVGLARAALWPQFSISAVAGISTSSGKMSSLSESAGLSLPLIGWFSLKAQADASVHQMAATVEDYHQTILSAWQEAQSSYADMVAADSRVTLSDKQAALSLTQVVRAQKLEIAGLRSRLDTLNVRISSLSADSAAIDEYSQLLQSWARLQKASFGV